MNPTIALVLRNRIVVVDLDFHATLWRELRNNDRVSNLAEDSRVGLAPKAVIKCMQVGSGDDVTKVDGLYKIPILAMNVRKTDTRLTSFELNVSASGARLGPLQNGWPVLVRASLGRLKRS